MARTISGTAASDELTGSADRDLIYGGRGKDTLLGLDGNDRLSGGDAGDRMVGGLGNDTYIVENTADQLVERLDEGTDIALVAMRRYKLADNVENLTFITARSHLGLGNGLDNIMTGNRGRDQLFGDGGSDTLIGAAGNDYLSGETGNDSLRGDNGNDTLYGGAGSDLLDGGSGGDRMIGGKGSDVYLVDSIRDRVAELAGGGNDVVRATASFTLSPHVEKLILLGDRPINGNGNALDNALTGNEKRNVLDGGRGDDTLDGGRGNDVLTGGEGADRFVFSTAPSSIKNADRITDFSRDESDKIVLSLDVFTDFDGAGKISPDAFRAGDGAVRAVEDGQFLIYDTATGTLYYDAEGPDGRNPVKLAQFGLSEHPALVWSDFLIVG